MANQRVSLMDTIVLPPATGDLIYIVDISEPVGSKRKKITFENFFSNIPFDIKILADSKTLTFGAGSDATIKYDGTDLLINPQLVGSGEIKVEAGNLNVVSGNILVSGTVDGIDIAIDVAANTTHLSSDGSDHTFIDQDITTAGTPAFAGISFDDNQLVTLGTGNDATIKYDGTDLLINPQLVGSGALKIEAGDLDIVSGNILVSGTVDGIDIATDVAANTVHLSSTGVDHANVVLNDTHRASAGIDHSDVVLNNTHRTSDGSDHTFLDQSLTIAATTVEFAALKVGSGTRDELFHIEEATGAVAAKVETGDGSTADYIMTNNVQSNLVRIATNGDFELFVDGNRIMRFDQAQTVQAWQSNSTAVVINPSNANMDFQVNADAPSTDIIMTDASLGSGAGGLGFFNVDPVIQPTVYTRNATIVEDKTLLASASATIINNNNVLAALINDLQELGLVA